MVSGHQGISLTGRTHRMAQTSPNGLVPLDGLHSSSQEEPQEYFTKACSENKLHMWQCVTGHPQSSHTIRISSLLAPVSYPVPDDQLSVHCEKDRSFPWVTTWKPQLRNTAQSRSPTNNAEHHFNPISNTTKCCWSGRQAILTIGRDLKTYYCDSLQSGQQVMKHSPWSLVKHLALRTSGHSGYSPESAGVDELLKRSPEPTDGNRSPTRKN